jgi:branched-subunit amino acid ABC-type transport system permease component
VVTAVAFHFRVAQVVGLAVDRVDWVDWAVAVVFLAVVAAILVVAVRREIGKS